MKALRVHNYGGPPDMKLMKQKLGNLGKSGTEP